MIKTKTAEVTLNIFDVDFVANVEYIQTQSEPQTMINPAVPEEIEVAKVELINHGEFGYALYIESELFREHVLHELKQAIS